MLKFVQEKILIILSSMHKVLNKTMNKTPLKTNNN